MENSKPPPATLANDSDDIETVGCQGNRVELKQLKRGIDEWNSTIQSEWKIMVIVLDRIFFLVSTMATAVAIAALFPRN